MHAVLAALLFGASTPLASVLAGRIAPIMLAGLLYAGSGCGLAIWLLLRRAVRASVAPDQVVSAAPDALRTADLPWLAGAVAAGGLAGPILLMIGLTHTPAASASLLLNMEGVLTALLAWCIFRENVDRRIALGMAFIVAGGVLLSWQGVGAGLDRGALAILGACLCWAIDNNLTRRIAACDALQIACIKGLAAGVVNLSIALLSGLPLPSWPGALGAAAVGFGGYGLSLVLFVLALRDLGTARTGAWFSVAPFAGAVLSLLLFGLVPLPAFWPAALLMAGGLWLHLRENHGHLHVHEPLLHAHAHVHGDGDPHHDHAHDDLQDPAWDGTGPHVHLHRHAPLRHAHAHYPDIHHRHPH